jgi:Glycine cleavage H-protein
MFPWVYGFTWQTGNVIFLTAFYAVAAIILATFGVAAVRAFRDLKSNHIDKIRWHVDFNELPDFAKSCRHVFTGELNYRVCPNEFDCRTCEMHATVAMVPRLTNSSVSSEPDRERLLRSDERERPHDDRYSMDGDAPVYGLHMPADCLYHRGHAWVQKERNGTLTIGLDDFGERIVGHAAYPELPEIGTELAVNGTGWHFRKGESIIRVLSPVDGEVVAVGGRDSGFYLKVRPVNDYDLRHLLKGAEVRPWIMRELERLETLLTAGRTGVTLADGGELVEDIPANYPGIDWDSFTGEMFLEP